MPAGSLAHSPVASPLRRWAETHLHVPEGDGPRGGRPYKVIAAPWRDVLDAMDDPALQQVTVRGSVQSGKTAALIAAALGHAAAGRSVLVFEPDDRLKRTLGARILLWGRACTDEAIRAAYLPKRPPFARQTAAAGRLEVVSAREGGAGLMRTAEIVIVDELRVFARDMLGELTDRMASYGGKGRLITASSAGYEDECRTTHELEKSDSRRWFLQCPACGQMNVPQWANLIYARRRWPVYRTPCCGTDLGERAFGHAIAAGAWRATKAEAVPGTRGFHLDAFTSPFETLQTIARQWKRADAHRKQTGSMAETIAFQQGRLALPFKPEAGQGVTPAAIETSCREDYDPDAVPAGASVVIGACDVQDNRLEAELSAWGVVEVEAQQDASNLRGWDGQAEFRGLRHEGKWYRLRRWALAYKRIHGDPGNPDIWNELAEFMEAPRAHATGPLLRPVTVAIDSGGHYTQQVAEFVRAQGPGYQCIKGTSRHMQGAPLARRSVTADSLDTYGDNGLLLIGADSGKASVYSLLRQSIGGSEPRPMVWPLAEDSYGPEEFEMLCSETLVRHLDKRSGRTSLQWKKIGRHNEALDLAVYSLASVSWLGVGFLLAERAAIEAATERVAA